MVRTQQLFSIFKLLPKPMHISSQEEDEMSRRVDFSTVPDDELQAINTSVLVVNAYTATMALQRDERKAVEAAIRAWRERNPNAGPKEASPAVAHILCDKL